ncbi:hypothetical protein S7711_01628 [Stachybotrys chartarum IBT 7711]|uniref:Heterokaryon incompatibility domain-containing protein n=1 Tax=Stachybotrys chartarum (strain CBS 109288 / IBT 7711) TaxID=1280523 RepID=A0A084BCA7_STACB|nr:hypothetical protein S7711_01628 [Stachybotrys chartarum IBT 7711]KFA56555.1 hypothetical protein S40293_01061 [Stachybotrys chartarum IBT 40293]
MAATLEQFVYTPLQAGEIRLLYPEIVSETEQRWSVKVVSLKDQLGQRTRLEYDALSYTWGDQTDRFPITLNGREIKIGHSLYEALPYLARRDSQLPIWIDGLCMNQQDDAEKTIQIRLMGEIYEAAQQVWVWLGPGTALNQQIIAKLPKLPRSNYVDVVRTYHLVGSGDQIVHLLSSDEAWSTLYDLIDNKWYSRLWVYQETAFAKRIRVLLGEHEVNWDVLERATTAWASCEWDFVGADGRKIRAPSKSANNIFLARHIGQRFTMSGTAINGEDFAKVLQQTMCAHCLDPRDRVNALLRFAQPNLPIDAPLQDMYSCLSRALFQVLRPSDYQWWEFVRLAASANKRPGLPSWCPDFHDVAGRAAMPGAIRKIDQLLGEDEEHFCPSKRRSRAEWTRDLHSKELVMRGQIFDRLETILPGLDDLGVSGDFCTVKGLRAFLAWEKLIASSLISSEGRSKPEGYKLTPGAYWGMMNGGHAENCKTHSGYASLDEFRQEEYEAWEAIYRLALSSKYALVEALHSRSIPQLTRHWLGVTEIYIHQKGRRIFKTTGGRVGFGPANVEAGDCVCIFNCAMTAHILRPTADINKKTYIIIGEAYVHGMMHGEVEELSLEEQDITLV